ncbi:MAG: META domain-containing protein [Tannerellaceae bacterium]
MNKGIYFSLLVIAIVLLSGCKSQKAAVASFNDLDGTWGVVEMNGAALDPAVTGQQLVFDVARQTLSGNAGCNRIMGKVAYDQAQPQILKFPSVASTRMACPDMKGEMELLQTLNKIVRFEAQSSVPSATTIALYGTDGSRLMVISKMVK